MARRRLRPRPLTIEKYGNPAPRRPIRVVLFRFSVVDRVATAIHADPRNATGNDASSQRRHGADTFIVEHKHAGIDGCIDRAGGRRRGPR